MICDEKLAWTQSLIGRVVKNYKRPVITWSGGKDSMVLLHIIRKQLGLDLPVIFYREPFGQRKYEFANSIIREWDLTIYEYPPTTTSVVKRGQHIEIINWYQVGKSFAAVPTGIRAPEDGKHWLCGLDSFYNKPTGSFHGLTGDEFPWDICFVGHKSSDIDPILGEIPLLVDIKISDVFCHYAFPLRHWTDDSIWEYTERYGVPFNAKRYDKANGYREFADITWNNDYHHACTLCLDKDQPTTVFCPKLKAEIPNISSQIRTHPPLRFPYIAGNEREACQH